MMDHLIAPDALARSRIQSDQAFSKQSVAWPPASEEIVGGRAEGQIDVAERLVRAHHRPDVRGSCRFPGVLLPGFIAELALARDGTELPQLLAGANIEAPHVAGRHLLYKRNIVNLGPHYHDVAADDRRGGNAVEMPINRTA
jgi:hypothetical protein